MISCKHLLFLTCVKVSMIPLSILSITLSGALILLIGSRWLFNCYLFFILFISIHSFMIQFMQKYKRKATEINQWLSIWRKGHCSLVYYHLANLKPKIYFVNNSINLLSSIVIISSETLIFQNGIRFVYWFLIYPLYFFFDEAEL